MNVVMDWDFHKQEPVVAGATVFSINDLIEYRDHLNRKARGFIRRIHAAVLGSSTAQVEQIEPKIPIRDSEVIYVHVSLERCLKV